MRTGTPVLQPESGIDKPGRRRLHPVDSKNLIETALQVGPDQNHWLDEKPAHET